MWGKAVVLSCLALLFSVTGTVRAELVGHWRLDEGTGGQVVDATGRGHDGTINGATWSSPGSNGKRTCWLWPGGTRAVNSVCSAFQPAGTRRRSLQSKGV